MSLNRGPSDTDAKPEMVCHGCQTLAPCYRGSRISVIETDKGTFERFSWWCKPCLRKKVGEALRRT